MRYLGFLTYPMTLPLEQYLLHSNEAFFIYYMTSLLHNTSFTLIFGIPYLHFQPKADCLKIKVVFESDPQKLE